MKKFLLFTFLSVFSFAEIGAQCTPDTTIGDLITPPAGSRFDTVNGKPLVILPIATVGQPYSQTLNFKVPSDSFVSLVNDTVDINFVRLDTVLGLPSGFAITCNNANCEILGGDFGCLQMTGTPSVADSVELRIGVTISFTFAGNPTPIKDTLGGYYFVSRGTIGLEEKAKSKRAPRVFPNPADKSVFINFKNDENGMADLTVTSIIGSVVEKRSVNLTGGNNRMEVNVRDFRPGVYVYSIRTEHQTLSGRFTVSH